MPKQRAKNSTWFKYNKIPYFTMNLFHRQQSGRKQASLAAMRGIIIFTSAFLAVSGLACSSSQNQINSKGGGSVVRSRLMEREDPPKDQAAQKDSLKNVVPSMTDTLILSPKARELVEYRIKQLKEMEKKMTMPGTAENALTDKEMALFFKEYAFVTFELSLYESARDGDLNWVKKTIDRINGKESITGKKGLGEQWGEQERADWIVRDFNQIINVK